MNGRSAVKLRRLLIALLLIAALGLSACGGDDDNAGAEGDGDNGVGVQVQEWSVVPDSSSASAGEVTFTIENVGTETHEFVVIKTDLGATDLPTAEDGSVSEEGEGMEVVDEVEDLADGSSETLTVNLEAGHYVFICNILEGSESHYQNGMRTEFDVV